jgi:hypothetical protein
MRQSQEFCNASNAAKRPGLAERSGVTAVLLPVCLLPLRTVFTTDRAAVPPETVTTDYNWVPARPPTAPKSDLMRAG